MRILVLSIITLLMTACASMGPLKEEQKKEINDVAVLSLFEDKMPVFFMATTVFGNEENKVDVSSWNLNDVVTKEYETNLKSIGKTYKKVSFDKKKIAEAIEKGNNAVDRLAGNTDKYLMEYITTTAAAQGAKYVFLVEPSQNENHPQAKGFGLFCRAPMAMKGDWQAYFMFSVGLYDVQTKKMLFGASFNPETAGIKSGKPCMDIKSSTPEKFALSFKEQLLNLAKTTNRTALQKSGLVK